MQKGFVDRNSECELYIHLLDLTRSSCEKSNYRPSGKNRTYSMVMRIRHSRCCQLSKYIHTRTFRPQNPSVHKNHVTYFNFRHVLISPGNFHGIISFRWHFRCRINIINSARQILQKNYIELRWKKEFTLITHWLRLCSRQNKRISPHGFDSRFGLM